MTETRAPFWESPRLWLAIALATALPSLGATILPFNDLPNHVGRHAVFLAAAAGDPFFARFYSVHWLLAGNLGIDCIVRVIGPVLGAELATRIAVGLIPPLTIAGTYALARAFSGRIPPAALLAAPLALNWPLITGFTNFSLSAAIALLVLALWVRLRGLAFGWRLLIFAPLSFVTWVAHTAGWGLLGLGVLAFEIERALRRPFRPIALLLAPLQTIPFALMALFTVLWRQKAGNGASVLYADHQLASKATSLVSLFREQILLWDVASTAIFGGLCLAFLLAGRRLVRPAAAIALAYLIAFVLCPQELFKSGFADRRLLTYGAMLVPLALGDSRTDPLARRRLATLAAITLAFFAARIAVSTVLWGRASRANEAHLALANVIPERSRIFGLMLETCGTRWVRIGRPDHIQQYAIPRRHSMVSGMFQNPGLNQVEARFARPTGFDPNMLALVHDARCPVPYIVDTLQSAMARFPRAQFDYVWIIGEEPPRGFDTSGLRLIASQGDDRIYRIVR